MHIKYECTSAKICHSFSTYFESNVYPNLCMIYYTSQGSQYWHPSKEDNQKFFEELLSAARVSQEAKHSYYHNLAKFFSLTRRLVCIPVCISGVLSWVVTTRVDLDTSCGQSIFLSILKELKLYNDYRYAHYDNNPSFSDFEPFGGWSRPAIKQFAGDKSVCGAGIDENYY